MPSSFYHDTCDDDRIDATRSREMLCINVVDHIEKRDDIPCPWSFGPLPLYCLAIASTGDF